MDSPFRPWVQGAFWVQESKQTLLVSLEQQEKYANQPRSGKSLKSTPGLRGDFGEPSVRPASSPSPYPETHKARGSAQVPLPEKCGARVKSQAHIPKPRPLALHRETQFGPRPCYSCPQPEATATICFQVFRLWKIPFF